MKKAKTLTDINNNNNPNNNNKNHDPPHDSAAQHATQQQLEFAALVYPAFPEFHRLKNFLYIGALNNNTTPQEATNLLRKYMDNNNIHDRNHVVGQGSRNMLMHHILGEYLLNNNTNRLIITLKALINNGGNVNSKNNQGRTPLNYAIFKKFPIEVIRFLLELNANVNITNNNGAAPIHAFREDNVKILHLLLQHGANPHHATNDGGTPLHCACYKGFLNIARTLIEECNVNINVLDNDGRSPLHCAIQWKHDDVVSLLLGNNAIVNTVARNGSTPLHAAILNRKYVLACILIKKNEDIILPALLNLCSQKPNNDRDKKKILYNIYWLLRKDPTTIFPAIKKKEMNKRNNRRWQ